MSDFISFNEGRVYLATHGGGLPTTCYFLLSTKDCDTHVVGDTLAGGVGEVTYWTGGARLSEAAPTPSSANPSVISFAQKSWTTTTHSDGPASVKSVVLVTSADNSGKAICAWNLQTGGAARDLSGANTTENFTPTLNVA